MGSGSSPPVMPPSNNSNDTAMITSTLQSNKMMDIMFLMVMMGFIKPQQIFDNMDPQGEGAANGQPGNGSSNGLPSPSAGSGTGTDAGTGAGTGAGGGIPTASADGTNTSTGGGATSNGSGTGTGPTSGTGGDTPTGSTSSGNDVTTRSFTPEGSTGSTFMHSRSNMPPDTRNIENSPLYERGMELYNARPGPNSFKNVVPFSPSSPDATRQSNPSGSTNSLHASGTHQSDDPNVNATTGDIRYDPTHLHHDDGYNRARDIRTSIMDRALEDIPVEWLPPGGRITANLSFR